MFKFQRGKKTSHKPLLSARLRYLQCINNRNTTVFCYGYFSTPEISVIKTKSSYASIHASFSANGSAAFIWKLHCHWLKSLQCHNKASVTLPQCNVTALVRHDPGMEEHRHSAGCRPPHRAAHTRCSGPGPSRPQCAHGTHHYLVHNILQQFEDGKRQRVIPGDDILAGARWNIAASAHEPGALGNVSSRPRARECPRGQASHLYISEAVLEYYSQ